MPNLNRVMLMGNLTRDPELRYLPTSNTAVAGFGLAINRKWKTPGGEAKEEVAFIDCEAFGKTAEVLNQYLKKGRPVYVEGRLKLDQWKDKEGQPRSKMKVVVESFQFIDGNRGEGNAAPPADRQTTAAAPRIDGPHQPIQEDDIPFTPAPAKGA